MLNIANQTTRHRVLLVEDEEATRNYLADAIGVTLALNYRPPVRIWQRPGRRLPRRSRTYWSPTWRCPTATGTLVVQPHPYYYALRGSANVSEPTFSVEVEFTQIP